MGRFLGWFTSFFHIVFSIGFLYLFYRLVLAIEKIAEKR